MVGSCVPRKGVHYAVEALALLDDQNLSLIVAGSTDDGQYVSHIRKLSKCLGVQNAVQLTGRLPTSEIIKLYRHATAFLLPTSWEGFGIVIVEAFLFGLPVIATDVGAVSELVVDGKNGLLVPPHSPQDLCKAIRTLLDDDDLRRRLSTGALKTAHEVARHWLNVVDDVERILAEVRRR